MQQETRLKYIETAKTIGKAIKEGKYGNPGEKFLDNKGTCAFI